MQDYGWQSTSPSVKPYERHDQNPTPVLSRETNLIDVGTSIDSVHPELAGSQGGSTSRSTSLHGLDTTPADTSNSLPISPDFDKLVVAVGSGSQSSREDHLWCCDSVEEEVEIEVEKESSLEKLARMNAI